MTDVNLARRIAYRVACGGGVGFIPPMPGTLGSLIALVLYIPIADFSPVLYLLVWSVFCLLSTVCVYYALPVFAARDNARDDSRDDSQNDSGGSTDATAANDRHRRKQISGISGDPPAIVIDEIAGALLAFVALPPGWVWLAAAFVLFRIFDIWKPWPIGWIDRHIKGASGIMTDDILAGLYAVAVIQITAGIMAW